MPSLSSYLCYLGVALSSLSSLGSATAIPRPGGRSIELCPKNPMESNCTSSLSHATLEKAFSDGKFTFSTKATISFSGDDQFTSTTNRWNLYKAPTFSASITAGTEEDVATAVKLARSLNMCFLATSTRHGYGTTMAKFQGGLAIDMSQLTDVELTDETATVGPGITNGDVLKPVNDAGFQVPTGSCSCVSTIGAVTGGGVGRWSGVFGLIIDGLVSVRMVTHEGKIITVSETENSDLFWGLRGAASNYGIIVAASYKLRKQINNGTVYSADVMYTTDKAEAYYKLIEEMNEKQPGELSITSAIVYMAAVGGPVIGGNFLYHGTEEDAMPYIEPFLALEPILSTVGPMSWTEVTDKVMFASDAGICEKGKYRGMYSANVKKFDAATFVSSVEKMVAYWEKYPDGQGSGVVFEMFPNHAVLETPESTTAYPWRDATGNFMFQMIWPEPGTATERASHALGKELRDDYAKSGGYDGLSVYVNYAYGDETLEEIYGKSKLPKLVALKKKWDPQNVFRYSNPLPMSYP